MCLINFAYKIDSTYDLVVAANRDEFYQRETAKAHFWEEAPHVLAGRDLEKMGTWMGVTKSGRFAALTNYRAPNEDTEGKRTRGELVSDFLKGSASPREYLEAVHERNHSYPGFNLLVSDGESLFYYSNRERDIRELEPGIYGLSNHLLDTPWPKVQKGKEGLGACLETTSDGLDSCLFQILEQAEPANDEDLPDTGIPLEWERSLSSLFIDTPNYGTRASTLVYMNEEQVRFVERVYEGGTFGEETYILEK
ncbi:hypothetical protein N780_15580 [Pontibacillus chungwhensis BH030062]|uniref:NRDE family protein n=1 Tax=Pontibacillus chungwhensis BH030062 TaxID=1385513 RepID=A0A0A2UZ48_9BACI|nr:NRDE family protein [Pontibacillus chungwhensis]KGP91796.1 hypothetical protein N780_15580 [Pontibacillus chungwhensis BH030062]